MSEHAARQQRDAHAGDDAAEHRVIGADLDACVREYRRVRANHVLQPLAMRAAVLEDQDGACARVARPI